MYTYHLQQEHPEILKAYVIVNYPATEDGGSTFDAPISWSDLRNLLELDSKESRLRESSIRMILSYLASDKLDSYESKYRVGREAIFLNIAPLIVNAARLVIPVVKPFVNARSLEAKTFLDLFESVHPADTRTHIVDKINIFLPTN